MAGQEIKIFELEDGKIGIQVQFENETVWLTQKQMSSLFEKDSNTIGLHIKNIYLSGELDESSTTEFFPVVQEEGKRKIKGL